MARPPSILCLLLITLSGIDALRVTMKTSLVSALKGEDVTIPCDIINLDVSTGIAVYWTRRILNGIEEDVNIYDNGRVTMSRLGSYMVEREILKGNAELHIPGVEFSDNGEYTCTVYNTPKDTFGKVSLQVNAVPSCIVPKDMNIELGSEKTAKCEVHGFYPQNITIRWELKRKGSFDCEQLQMWTCVKSTVINPDGTYSVTSLLTLTPEKQDDGNKYSCVVSHRSLQSDIIKSFILTVTEREDNTERIIAAVVSFFIILIILVLGLWLSCKMAKKDPPTLSPISGNDELTDMNKTTLTCQIMKYRPDDITVSVRLRRCGQPGETIHTWKSRDHTATAMLTTDGANMVVNVDEESMLMNGAVRQEDSPLQLEVAHQITCNDRPVHLKTGVLNRWRRRIFGTFCCQCFLSITPSYDMDNGAELSILVTHPALTSVKSVQKVLKVTGVPPVLKMILAPKCQKYKEKSTLTCQISEFKPRALSIIWLRRDKNDQESELISWNSGRQIIHNGKYTFELNQEEHHDKSYSIVNSLIMKSAETSDDGITYICRAHHPATQKAIEEEHTVKVIAAPVLEAIEKKQEVVYANEKLDLSCRIHSFYPSLITVTWYSVDEKSMPSVTSEPLLDPSTGLYHVTSKPSYTPTIKDEGKSLRCAVQHESLTKPKYVNWTLKDLISQPHVDNIQSDPAEPEIGQLVTLSCKLKDIYPGGPQVQWSRSSNIFLSEQSFQEDTGSGMFCGTTKLKLTPSAADHGTTIQLKITHAATNIHRDFIMKLKGLPVLTEITTDPLTREYGRPLTLCCRVNGGDIMKVIWTVSEGQVVKGQPTETRTGNLLACTLKITPTAVDYGKIYTCNVYHRNIIQPFTKNVNLKLPAKPPTLSDIKARPVKLRVGQETSFRVTVSGFSPRDMQVKWYKGFHQFPHTDVSSSEPQIGEDNLYALTSTLTFTPGQKDDNISIRCEASHSITRTIRDKHYTLHLTDRGNGQAPADTGK
ncbi:uncharacterized protein [Hyperolius riggenbachi]|uniref:uncharacterized protein n=1 Tax=Hyperolius riggenbachi TaxID=752182 RepID=UPI0035A38AF5